MDRFAFSALGVAVLLGVIAQSSRQTLFGEFSESPRPAKDGSLLQSTGFDNDNMKAHADQILLQIASRVDSSYGLGKAAHIHEQEDDEAVGDAERRQLYKSRVAAIDAHNSRGMSWAEAVNKFVDFTDLERRQLLGYRRSKFVGRDGPRTSSLLESASVIRKAKVVNAMDWGALGLKSSAFFRNQGGCGSCWAVAAVGAIEMHAELRHGNSTRFSAEQMIDCSPNPQHCGGSGGCNGATAELAFEYVQTRGLAADSDYPIDNSDDQCHDSTSKMTLKVGDFVRLPVNEGNPLLQAIAAVGPSVVSVDGSSWFSYSKGIFAGCEKDAIVNHAVLLIGYGLDDATGHKYWRIRNSWGEDWGEKGHIRLLRHDNDDDYCGIDTKPQDGVGCEGGPATLPVCGMCGVLSDSSYPTELSFSSI